MRLLAGLALAIIVVLRTGASPVRAENTLDDWSWRVDHFKRFGIWESVCDHKERDGRTLRRCYVGYVDVYAPRPKFGAAFVFVTAAGEDGLVFDFRFEPGTRFEKGGFAFVREGKPLWSPPPENCRNLRCVLSNRDAETLAALMRRDGHLRLAFSDRHGRNWERVWPAEEFAGALDDLAANARRRGLL